MCNNRQICNVCEGTFEMTRGCNLEKRCLACRFLNLQKGKPDKWLIKHIYLEEIDQRELFNEPTIYEDFRYDVSKLSKDILSVLTDRERLVIKEYICKDESSIHIAETLNVSRVRITQIYNNAIKKLKYYKNNRKMYRWYSM